MVGSDIRPLLLLSILAWAVHPGLLHPAAVASSHNAALPSALLPADDECTSSGGEGAACAFSALQIKAWPRSTLLPRPGASLPVLSSMIPSVAVFCGSTAICEAVGVAPGSGVVVRRCWPWEFGARVGGSPLTCASDADCSLCGMSPRAKLDYPVEACRCATSASSLKTTTLPPADAEFLEEVPDTSLASLAGEPASVGYCSAKGQCRANGIIINDDSRASPLSHLTYRGSRLCFTQAKDDGSPRPVVCSSDEGCSSCALPSVTAATQSFACQCSGKKL